MVIHVGTSGWTHFHSSGDPLLDYSRAFDIVEVDLTFYNIPSEEVVKRWKKRVTADFLFSVKANKVITHDEKMKNTQLAKLALSRTNKICRLIGAKVMIFEKPPSLSLDEETSLEFCNMVSSQKGLQEIFVDPGRDFVQPDVVRIMAENGIQLVFNPLVAKKERKMDCAYAKIRGPENNRLYQPDDHELGVITDELKRHGTAFAIFTGPKKYRNAARLKMYANTGEIIPVTTSIGMDSAIEVIDSTDINFPVTKERLTHRIGGLLFDQLGDARARLDEYLSELPSEEYSDKGELIKDLRKII